MVTKCGAHVVSLSQPAQQLTPEGKLLHRDPEKQGLRKHRDRSTNLLRRDILQALSVVLSTQSERDHIKIEGITYKKI